MVLATLISDLMQKADEAVQSMGLNRSRFLVRAVGNFLTRNREEQMLRQLNEAYEDDARPNEKQLLNPIKAKLRRVVKDRW
jgi:hypothetical protein